MIYVYVIYNLEHHRFYYGICSDLEKTEKAHNEGKMTETRDIAPWTVVYHEEFGNKQQAVRRLRFLRSQAGYYFLKKILHF
ncbi:MAG: GIY-YIG nuclease family protein [Mangrovibacterium sp.]|jgi:putative endonuclease